MAETKKATTTTGQKTKTTTKTTKATTTKKAETSAKSSSEVKPSDLIDVRICAVPERKEMVEKLQKILGIPDKNIIWDKDHKGIVWTSRNAWKLETDKPYVMVLQDDSELCKDFMKYCEKIVTLHPDFIISLFPYQFRTHNKVRNRERKTPYVTTKFAMGLAIIMKVEYINDCVATWSEDLEDDVSITRWAKAHEIPILTTLPSIIQHVGHDSIHNPDRTLGMTAFYNPDPKDENWDDPFVTPWSSIVPG